MRLILLSLIPRRPLCASYHRYVQPGIPQGGIYRVIPQVYLRVAYTRFIPRVYLRVY